jgi:hypothetical protein
MGVPAGSDVPEYTVTRIGMPTTQITAVPGATA